MTIYKQPEFNVCTCSTCGTVFKPEASDTLEYLFRSVIGIDEFDVFARCPTCNYSCPVTVIKEDVTDNNVGHKTGSEGKYLTPSDVKKMTPREVKENYDLIIQSMGRWNKE